MGLDAGLQFAITDLQLWVLGQDLISDMRISILMKDVGSKHNEIAPCGFGAEVCNECTFQTLWVLNQRVRVEIDAVHLR